VRSRPGSLRTLVLVAPLLFILHVVEEAPGFVAWFNGLVPRGITQELFLAVNTGALLITLAVVLLVVTSPGPASGLALAAWIGFLMLANGAFHLAATAAHERYAPGVVTGTLLYLPYGVLVLRRVVRDLKVPAAAVVGSALAGAAPMLAHGFLIVFRGSRLF
jgi:hypothetical protein